MSDRPEREYQLSRPMTGDEIRDHLKRAMRYSWYQETKSHIQVMGLSIIFYWPSSISELRLYSPLAGWTEGIVGSETYTALRFPDDFVHLFAAAPDKW